ncbi:hypothetical protein Gotur_005355 [Gossypium turneri]
MRFNVLNVNVFQVFALHVVNMTILATSKGFPSTHSLIEEEEDVTPKPPFVTTVQHQVELNEKERKVEQKISFFSKDQRSYFLRLEVHLVSVRVILLRWLVDSKICKVYGLIFVSSTIASGF